jgi:RNA ligase (TIGR02306 family)
VLVIQKTKKTNKMSLATIEQIVEIKPFPDPEVTRLEIAKVLNYECVVGKDTFKTGDLVVFVYPDSVLPDKKWAEPYRKYSKKRVKTVKIRSFLSFGIIESLENVGLKTADTDTSYEIGKDASKELGIEKYESEVPKDLKFKSMMLPFNIPVTDETKWQSVKNLKELMGTIVDVSLKIDGTSTTFYYVLEKEDRPAQFGLCSRNGELKTDSENVYTRVLKKYDIENKLKNYCEKHNVSLCLRGETHGQSVQNFSHNYHCKLPVSIAFFNVYNIDTMSYERRGSEHYYLNVCKELDLPVCNELEDSVELTQELIDKYDNVLNEIELESGKKIPFEGVVIKGPTFSFKVINKHYDMRK